MKGKLFLALLVFVMTLAALPMAASAAESPDYQTALIAQLEAGAKPSANNLLIGVSQWKNMEPGPERSAFSMRYEAIQKLDLSNMGLTQKAGANGDIADDALTVLEPFTGLVELDLSTKADASNGYKNELTNLNYLTYFPYLEKLDVSNNQLEAKSGLSDGITGLWGCSRLTELNLSGNKKLGSSGGVEDALVPLEGLNFVTQLNLSDTGFGDDDVQSVQAMESLRELDISNTPVRCLDLSGMVRLTRLTAKNLTLDSIRLPAGIAEMDLAGTKLKVTDETIDDAVAALRGYGDSGLKLVKSNNTNQEIYTITVADTVNGTASVDVQAASRGTKVAVTVSPDEGYAQDSVIILYADEKGEPKRAAVTNGEFTMPNGNVSVSVTFMPRNIAVEYNDWEWGSVSFDKENPARGERVDFVADVQDGYKIRQITGKIGSKSVPVYRRKDGTYCFDMPRLREDEPLVFTVTFVEIVTPQYAGSGPFGGRLTLNGLVEGQQYVCQMSEADANKKPTDYTIVTFTAHGTSEQLEVRGSTHGYIVSLWKYGAWAESVQDLTNVFYEEHTTR